MADQFIGEVLADKYRVDSVIRDGGSSSSGSLGKLYRGTHLLMDKPVAVKILSPALAVDEAIVKQFSAEVRTLSRLSHPNIPSVTDYGQDKNRAVFIVSEQGDGETLKNAVRREGQFSPERANRITQQIASALSAAHANGVLHQNLTSENVFLSKTADGADFVKVLDFGAAHADEQGVFDNVKTVEYLAPERFSGSDEADPRSDIYSLGVILYEMLAGEVPFTGENAADVMLKHAQEPPLSLSAFRSDLPNEIEMIVQRALAKVPENRYQSANDLADALNRATVFATRLSGAPSAATAAALVDDRPQNNLWKTAFIVLAGIAVLSGFFIYMTQVKQTNPQTTLQTDANGSPVQPVNPATGMTEQGLSNLGAYPAQDGNVNAMTQDIPPAGGGGYGNPWDRSSNPPPGAPAPQYVPPTGQYYDGNINPGSPFMAPDGNIYIPVPRNPSNSTVTNTQPKPRVSPTPPAAANTQPAPTNTRPAANTTTEPKTATTPRSTPKPVEQPKSDKPTSTGKVEES